MSNDTASKAQPSETLISEIAKMFVDWKRYFRNKIKDEDWGVDVVLDWAEILTELRITRAEFETAKNAVRLAGGWPPNHPADFLELARAGKKSEYPDVQTAFYTACKAAGMRGMAERDWGHVVVLETANRLGWGNLERASEGYINHFKKIYEKVISEHQAGADFVIKKEYRIEPPKPVKKLDPNSKIGKQWAELYRRFGTRKSEA